jgi:hypothetical protein
MEDFERFSIGPGHGNRRIPDHSRRLTRTHTGSPGSKKQTGE